MRNKFNCTRRLLKIGDSWAITFNKSLMNKKGFTIGDIVEVSVISTEDDSKKDETLINLVGEKMKKDNKKELTFKIVNDEKTGKKIEDNQNEL